MNKLSKSDHRSRIQRMLCRNAVDSIVCNSDFLQRNNNYSSVVRIYVRNEKKLQRSSKLHFLEVYKPKLHFLEMYELAICRTEHWTKSTSN